MRDVPLGTRDGLRPSHGGSNLLEPPCEAVSHDGPCMEVHEVAHQSSRLMRDIREFDSVSRLMKERRGVDLGAPDPRPTPRPAVASPAYAIASDHYRVSSPNRSRLVDRLGSAMRSRRHRRSR